MTLVMTTGHVSDQGAARESKIIEPQGDEFDTEAAMSSQQDQCVPQMPRQLT